jgi:LmbE family N-acetylglucosaminyl deacetylase
MSAFGIVTKKLLSQPQRLVTVFSWSNYMVISWRIFSDIRTIPKLVPSPKELVHSVERNRGRFGTRPINIVAKLLDLRQPTKVSRIRLLEDLSFSKRIGVKFSCLNLPCSMLRNSRVIMSSDWPLTYEQKTLDRLSLMLKRVISMTKAEAILAPWPYGSRQHIDHRLVQEAAGRVAGETGVELLYVDDQPYSRRPLKTMVDGRGRRYSPVVVNLDASEMERKYRAMKLYGSQMTQGYMEAVRKPPPGSPDSENSETLWQPS